MKNSFELLVKSKQTEINNFHSKMKSKVSNIASHNFLDVNQKTNFGLDILESCKLSNFWSSFANDDSATKIL